MEPIRRQKRGKVPHGQTGTGGRANFAVVVAKKQEAKKRHPAGYDEGSLEIDSWVVVYFGFPFGEIHKRAFFLEKNFDTTAMLHNLRHTTPDDTLNASFFRKMR